jgi:hypothetical protein
MEPRFRRAVRDAEHLGDPREWQVEIEMEDENGPRLRLESSQGTLEEVAIDHPCGRVGEGRFEEWRELDLDHPSTPLAGDVDACVGDEAVQPVVEGTRVAQAADAPPRPDQGLLDGVLGQIRVAKDEARSRVQARTGRASELSEGELVAMPRSFDESVPVHESWPSVFGAATVVVLDSLRRRRQVKRFNLWGPAR